MAEEENIPILDQDRDDDDGDVESLGGDLFPDYDDPT